jgi:hypothetical protein
MLSSPKIYQDAYFIADLLERYVSWYGLEPPLVDLFDSHCQSRMSGKVSIQEPAEKRTAAFSRLR